MSEKNMLKVVAFDDNPLTLQSIITTVDWAGLGCTLAGTADNGVDALKIVSDSRADIIVSDIKMPGLDGLALAEAVIKMEIHAKIILITGFLEFELAQSALKLGVFDLLAKPFSSADICGAIKNSSDALMKERREYPRLIPPGNDASPLVRRAVNYLEQIFSENVSLEYVSEKLYVNPSYLSRTIKKETGRGFIEILTEIRLEKAKSLLGQPENKIYEIARQVGYNDYAYFFQVFKKRYGISPNEYRKRSFANGAAGNSE